MFSLFSSFLYKIKETLVEPSFIICFAVQIKGIFFSPNFILIKKPVPILIFATFCSNGFDIIKTIIINYANRMIKAFYFYY